MKRLVASLLFAAAAAAAFGLVTASAHTHKHAAKLRVFRVALAGENETPAGDPVATGSATIRARAGQARVCYTLVARAPPSRTPLGRPCSGSARRRGWSATDCTLRT